ncbi:MAG: Ig-like domain-containing protein, partial [Anaerolineales bacterium]
MRDRDGDSQGDQVNPPLVDTSTDSVEGGFVSDDGDSLLLISLSEGQAGTQDVEPIPTAAGDPLSEDEIERILARLPFLVVEAEDQEEFKLPEDSLPPPRTGETIDEIFPRVEIIEPEPVDTGPLEVLRYSPEGEIPLAPFVNITFNQPMVPLATLSELALIDVPVQLTPDVPGTWRWVGTKTLTFEHDSTQIDRLPKATEYQVIIPAGTTSATGGVLKESVRWTFSTPPPKMTTYSPSHGPQALDPLIFIAFDQRIDPSSVLATIQVTADGHDVTIQLVTEEEIEKDKNISRLVKNIVEGRWLVIRAEELFPSDADISISVGPGTPSAEGPLVTQEAQSFSFRTYAPLTIEDHGCTWSRDDCHPLTPFFIRFNNPLDIDAYDDLMIAIDPPIAGASVNIFGNTINIQGATEGSTTYRVTVDKGIKDIFGQTLGKSERLTFRVGRAEPFLTGPDKFLVTLDPGSSEPIFSVYSLNYNKLDVKIYSVQPEEWPNFKEYLNEYHRQDPPPAPPGRLVLDETMNLEAPSDVLIQVDIDLGRVMDGDFGHFIVIVEPTRGLLDLDPDRYWPIIQSWVQATQIGLDAIVDHSEMVVWTSDLQDGAPLAGVEIEAKPSGRISTTGEDGTARFNLPPSGTSFLVASKGIDTVILPHSYYWDESTWSRRSVNDELRWYVFDDRQMYRPGEEVHLKGWIRQIGGKQDGDVGLVGAALEQISYRIIGPQGNTLNEGFADANGLGGFDFAFTLPENANLGYAQIQLNAVGNLSKLSGTSYYHSFQIQEFRRPEFEVIARNESVGPYFVGEYATVAVEAKYFAGGPLTNAEVNWLVTSSPSNYHPPNWPDFIFGTWNPWWYYGDVMLEVAYSPFYPEYADVEVETFIGITDASGNHYLRLDFDEASEPRPFSVLAEGTVFDVNRQAWASGTSLLVHPANLYVGMQSDRTFVERGTPLEINLIVTDLDGNPTPDRPIEVTAGRLEWKYSGNTWKEEIVDVQTCVVGSEIDPVSCTFDTNLGGRYQVTAVVTDEMGRRNQSRFTRWVSGGQRPPSREVEQEAVSLIPDKETYQLGDVANILVQAPFSPAEGQLIISRSGILYTERFEIEEDTITLHVPIEEAHIPNLHVQVDLVGAAPRTDDEGEIIEDVAPRPAYATGQLNLNIPPLQRTLSLEVIPSETELEPGGETSLSLSLTDARGEPVSGAELAVVIVDEAVLALSNYQLADPITIFYRQRSADISGYYGRASIVLVDPQALLEAAKAGGEGAFDVAEEAVAAMGPSPTMTQDALGRAFDDEAGLSAETSPIRVRTDFNPLATFAPEVKTDVNGRASVEVK